MKRALRIATASLGLGLGAGLLAAPVGHAEPAAARSALAAAAADAVNEWTATDPRNARLGSDVRTVRLRIGPLYTRVTVGFRSGPVEGLIVDFTDPAFRGDPMSAEWYRSDRPRRVRIRQGEGDFVCSSRSVERTNDRLTFRFRTECLSGEGRPRPREVRARVAAWDAKGRTDLVPGATAWPDGSGWADRPWSRAIRLPH